jgi:thiol-disulfide isomerase/thioredoxin
MLISLSRFRFLLSWGISLGLAQTAFAVLPLTSGDVLLMLRGGSSAAEVSRELASRKVLEPLTPDLQKKLVAAGADASLISLYERSLLSDQKAAAARTDLEQRKNAQALSRAKTMEEIASIPEPARSTGIAGSVSPFLQSLQGDLVTATNEKYRGSLANKRFIGLYFSASWCGPCREFTPDFVQFYQQLKGQHSDFEVIFVSRDKSEKEMLKYMTGDQMPWPALAFSASESAKLSIDKYKKGGIPNLVLLDSNGQILSESYRNGDYVGPREVLSDWVNLYSPKK